MKSLRTISASLLVFAFAACSDTPTAPLSLTSAALAKGGNPSPTPTPTPASAVNLAGHWSEVQGAHFRLPDGTYQVTWYEFDATQKGTVLDGIVNRYVSYFDVNDQPIVTRRDLGTPGKLSGSINTGVSPMVVTIGFIRVSEAKLTSGYTTTLSPDKATLTVQNPKSFGPTAFVR